MIDKKLIEENGRRGARKVSHQETKEHLKILVENSSVGRMRKTR